MELTPKEQYIKKHWVKLMGEDNFKHLTLDEHGYSDKTCRVFLPREYGGIIESHLERPSGRSCYHRMLYRPRSLKGFEDNNGWVVVNSYKDLPDMSGLYHVEVSDSIIGIQTYTLKFDTSNYYFHYLENGKRVLDEIIAWKPINTPPKRLY
jgi:hypothetical protein